MNMNETPISVIVPNYNSESYLEKCMPVGEMVREAIREAWFFWQNRKRFGVHATEAELKKTVPDLFRITMAGARLWRHPRHVVVLNFYAHV